MGENQNKNLSFNKRTGEISVPVVGAFALVEVILVCIVMRPLHVLDLLIIAAIASAILVIGLTYYRFTRRLNSLTQKIDEESLSSLFLYASNLTISAYVCGIFALVLILHHLI